MTPTCVLSWNSGLPSSGCTSPSPAHWSHAHQLPLHSLHLSFYYFVLPLVFLPLLLLFSHSLMSNSLWPCGLQCTRPPCPSPSSGVFSDSCPLNQWCHPTISSSVAPSFCPQSFPESRSFPMSWFFASGGQSITASASVLPMNNQGWFPLELTGLISLLSKGLWRVFSSITVWKH